MNTMEALGTGQTLSPKGEAPGLNLGADAETLALFASLFAMMQTPQPGSVEGGETFADSQALHMQPGSEDGKPPLPAAAMLMAGLEPAAEIAGKTKLPGEEGAVEGDAAGLLKLLLAAQDIAAPGQQPVAPTTTSDDSADAITPARTATEMLTGAIEILKALETAPKLQMPDIAPAADDLPKEPAPMVMASPSPEFVGPMPAVKLAGPMPAPIITEHAEADFIGPMPVVTLSHSSTTLPSPVMVLQAEPEFIGPMPAVKTQTTSSAAAVVVLADPDFIGLLPEAEPSMSRPLPAVVLHADPDFIGPMPAVATPMTTPSQQTIAADGSGTLPHNIGTNTAPNPGPSPDPNPGPNPLASLTQSSVVPNDLQREADQMLKSGLPEAGLSDESADQDEGFVRQRADMFAAGKRMTEKTAEQKMAAGMQATRMAAMRAVAEISKPSSTPTSASGLAQQMAASLTSGQASATSGQDAAQAAANTAANTAGGQGGTSSGGHSGGQPSGQQSAQQMADGGLARGAADRTLLHRLNTDNAGWSETMVKRLSADLSSGVQKVRIILEPRQLGRLNVELGVRDGGASIRIAAETQEAARLLSGARGQLGHMLENAGMRLASFQATGSQAGDAGLDNGQGSQGRGGDGSGDQGARNNAGRNQEFSNKIATALDETADGAIMGEDTLREGETAVLSILA